MLGEHGVAETVTRAAGVDADTARQTIIAGIDSPPGCSSC